MLSLTVKGLLETHIDEIEVGNFDNLYEDASEHGVMFNIGELTDALYDAGIDPLATMTKVPTLFLDGSKITALVIPETVTDLSKAAFAFSQLSYIELHDNCELAESSFYTSNIESIKIPKLMNEVPEDCFYGCANLKTVDLNECTYIAIQAFAQCKKLELVIIPNDIENIDDGAFYGHNETLTFQLSRNNAYAIEYAEKHNIKVEFND